MKNLLITITILVAFGGGYAVHPVLNKLGGATGTTVASLSDSLNQSIKDFSELKTQHIDWIPPVTDAQAADDVKAEQIDLRGDKVLAEMDVSHRTKQIKVEKKYQDFMECLLCQRYAIKKKLETVYAISGETLEMETDIVFQQAYNNVINEKEKLAQSIERIEKEQELRAKGFVVTNDKGGQKLGGTVPANRIRKIID